MAPEGWKVVLFAAALLPACAATSAADPATDAFATGVFLTPSDEDPPGDSPRPAPEMHWETARIALGAGGFDGRVNGDAEGARTDGGADATGVSGYSLEIRTFAAEGEDTGTAGLLIEHFHDVVHAANMHRLSLDE